MTHSKAWEVAASWGIALTGREKGAVFYSLTGKPDQIRSEEHRADLLSYTEDCLVEAQSRFDAEVAKGQSEDREAAREDLEDLHKLKRYFEGTPSADSTEYLFLTGYIAAALFTSIDDSGEPLDDNYSGADIDQTVLAAMTADCVKFQTENAALLAEVYKLGTPSAINPEAYAGHNLWLTRNGHGTGFWDRGYPKPLADALTKASEDFGEVTLTVDEGTFFYE